MTGRVTARTEPRLSEDDYTTITIGFRSGYRDLSMEALMKRASSKGTATFTSGGRLADLGSSSLSLSTIYRWHWGRHSNRSTPY